MKLKSFNRTIVSTTMRTGEPQIHIHSQGQFTFNRAAATKYDLKPDSKIEIHQDEDEPTDWYWSVSTSEEAFVLRDSKSNGAVMFNSSALARNIFNSLDKGMIYSLTAPIAPEPEKVRGGGYSTPY